MVVLMADRPKSSVKSAATLKKVISTSNIRTMAEAENGDLSPADKKRNKLGYHRTAVACGHCRRRKIRCIPSPDTNTTRCQNCVRLKKDCQFFPVDQSVVTQTKRSRSDSKGEALVAESETSVSSSSPGIHTGVTSLDYDQYRAQLGTPPLSQGPESEYSHSYDQRPWYPSEHPQHPYWLQHEQNHPNSYTPSPYPITPTTTGQPITTQEHAYTYPAISLEHNNYPYPVPRPQDGSIAASTPSVPAFGAFRANTMPERLGMPEDGQRNHELHPAAMSLPSQQMMGASFPPLRGHPTQYAAPQSGQFWAPASTEPPHHSASYVHQNPSVGWYGQPHALNDVREDRDPASQDSNRFRKPG